MLNAIRTFQMGTLPFFLNGASMTNRRFELFEYRQVLVRMRQRDSDRDIGRSGLMGRKKLTAVRRMADERGWLNPGQPLPDDTVNAGVFGSTPHLPSTCVSTLEPFRERIRDMTPAFRAQRSPRAETQPWLHRQLLGGAPYPAGPEGRTRRAGHNDP